MTEHVALILVAALALPVGVWLGAWASQLSITKLAALGEKIPLRGRWYYLVPEGEVFGDLYAENRAWRTAVSKATQAIGRSEVTTGELNLLMIKGGTAGEVAEELCEIRKALTGLEPTND